MHVYTKEEALQNKRKIAEEIEKGAVFIYPTDTIYGLGCDATNDSAVKRIREIKGRETKPFSVIAPTKEWITQNCEAKELEKLPGPYTLILKQKNPKAASQQTTTGLETLGVRIPKHWITEIVKELGKPIITTSVNTIGQPFATKLEELQKFNVDFIIYEGEKKGKPSTIIDTTTGKTIER